MKKSKKWMEVHIKYPNIETTIIITNKLKGFKDPVVVRKRLLETHKKRNPFFIQRKHTITEQRKLHFLDTGHIRWVDVNDESRKPYGNVKYLAKLSITRKPECLLMDDDRSGGCDTRHHKQTVVVMDDDENVTHMK